MNIPLIQYNEIIKYLKDCIANGSLNDENSLKTIFLEINKKYKE
jgi:hypothetical protein